MYRVFIEPSLSSDLALLVVAIRVAGLFLLCTFLEYVGGVFFVIDGMSLLQLLFLSPRLYGAVPVWLCGMIVGRVPLRFA